jgi:hypothetical protein
MKKSNSGLRKGNGGSRIIKSCQLP